MRMIYIQSTIILQIYSNMNILSFEKMEQTEIQLLKIKSQSKFMLKLPTSDELTNIHHFQSKLFPFASPQIHTTIHKKVSFTDSLRTSGLQNQNAIFRMLTYHLLTTLYTQKDQGDSEKKNQNKQFLLKTIKCTLYSKETDFSYIRNCPFQLNNLQMKVLAANFFQYMQELSSNFNAYCLKCAEWLLENNPFLVELFTLLLRVILFYLKIPKAGNYKFLVDPRKSIIALMDFFDLEYQSSDNMFLQYQDGLLIAIVEGEIIIGEYFQNEGERQNHKKRYEIKSEVKMNMVESMIVTVNDQSPKICNQMKISKDDAKLFELLLHSKCDKGPSESIYVNDNDIENEKRVSTPQFNQKKQNQQLKKNQKYKFQFKEMTLNESLDVQKLQQNPDFNNQLTEPYSPVSKRKMFNQQWFKSKNTPGGNQLQLNNRQQLKMIDHSISMTSLINKQANKSINLQPKCIITHSRNKTLQQEFPSTVYTPQNIKSFDRTNAFNRRPSQQKKYQREENEQQNYCNGNNHTKMRPEFNQIVNCECHTKKIIRNNLQNKVIDVFFKPMNKNSHKKVQMPWRMPANKDEGVKSISNLRQLSSNGQSEAQMETYFKNNQINLHNQRKPTFLKNFKNTKREDKDIKILLNGTKSSQVLPYVCENEEDKHKRLSEMIPLHRQLTQPQNNSKSTTRDESLYQNHKIPMEPSENCHKQYSIIPCGRSSLDDPYSPWKTNEIFQQRSSYYTNANNSKNNLVIAELPTSSKIKLGSPNLNSPKQMISPNQHSNYCDYQHTDNQNPQRKRIQANQQIPPIIFEHQKHVLAVNKSEKVINCYAKKY